MSDSGGILRLCREHQLSTGSWLLLRHTLRAQYGVIARGQAMACGLTDAALEYRLRPGGPWQKIVPGVYLAVTGTITADQREMAALLHAGPRSVITGPSFN